jgi:hypothetical protein
VNLWRRYRQLASNMNGVKIGGGGRLWVLLQHIDYHALPIDFNDNCEHVTKVLSNPLVGSDAHVHAAKFAILWRLKNVGSFESPQRQIFDEVAPKP